MKTTTLLKKLMRLASFVALIGLFFYHPSFAQESGEYFEETGHYVDGVFLDYFNERGGLEIFGYPLSKPFIDQGILVQYFQKARMEWHPQNPESYKVQLGLLGDELKYRQPSVPEPTPKSRRKVYFPETGHTVTYAFLDFFNEYGGVDTFGYPITEMHFEEGKVVQYFQRMKLEWSPDSSISTVQVGLLGEVYISMFRGRMPVDALDSKSTDTIKPTAIEAVVSLRYWVLGEKREQAVSILVTDNFDRALPGATVKLHFTAENELLPGSETTLTTNEQGYAQITVPVNWDKSGTQIIVYAHVTYDEFTTSAQNVFLLWF